MKKRYITPNMESHMAPLLKPLCTSLTLYEVEDDALTHRRSGSDAPDPEEEEKDAWSEGLW